jgi:hypothetical protein
MEFNMTKFTKENILSDGMYVYFAAEGINTPWDKRKFIARFKHRGPVTKGKFLKTLIKHYTVEDYLTKLDAGRAPLQILEDDGHLIFDGKFFFLEGKVL